MKAMTNMPHTEPRRPWKIHEREKVIHDPTASESPTCLSAYRGRAVLAPLVLVTSPSTSKATRASSPTPTEMLPTLAQGRSTFARTIGEASASRLSNLLVAPVSSACSLRARRSFARAASSSKCSTPAFSAASMAASSARMFNPDGCGACRLATSARALVAAGPLLSSTGTMR